MLRLKFFMVESGASDTKHDLCCWSPACHVIITWPKMLKNCYCLCSDKENSNTYISRLIIKSLSLVPLALIEETSLIRVSRLPIHRAIVVSRPSYVTRFSRDRLTGAVPWSVMLIHTLYLTRWQRYKFFLNDMKWNNARIFTV